VVFGAIGRMTPVKNHRVLIEAFALVRAKYPGIRLRILGGGPLEEQLRGVANNLGLSESVELCGFDSDVAGFLSSIDVFALSSNSEGLPMSLLEAIASGLPVIATSVGGVPDVIRKTGSGWLSPPGEAAGLMKAMESAIQCPDRVAHGEKARRIVAEAYSSARMSADYERVYETLLRK
jgi:glycosyltransferase involved in cell wall biosynthesis